jgi:hypothetical protein
MVVCINSPSFARGCGRGSRTSDSLRILGSKTTARRRKEVVVSNHDGRGRR